MGIFKNKLGHIVCFLESKDKKEEKKITWFKARMEGIVHAVIIVFDTVHKRSLCKISI